jgi:starvation-inducible DNA-binding protein
MTDTEQLNFTVPGVAKQDADRAIDLVQQQLNDCNRLQLTLKHVHWNVVGPNFIAVHQMLDPQIDAVRAMADELAERIATLGGSPNGTPAALEREDDFDEYTIGRADTQEHLKGLDVLYRSVITSHREAVDELEKLDVVTQDLLVGQLHQLELFHWFIRAHVEDPAGHLATDA